MSLITDLHEIETDINIIRQKVGLPASATLANIAQAVGTGGGSSLPTFYHFNNLVERDQATAGLKDGDVAFVFGEKKNTAVLPSMLGVKVTNIHLPLEIRNVNPYTYNTGNIYLTSESDSLETMGIYRYASSIRFNIYGEALNTQASQYMEYGFITIDYTFNSISNSFRLAQASEQNYALIEHHQLKNDYIVKVSDDTCRNEDFENINVFDIEDIYGIYKLNQSNWEPFKFGVTTLVNRMEPTSRALDDSGLVYGENPKHSSQVASSYYSTLSTVSNIDLSYAFANMAFNIDVLTQQVSANKITNMSYCFYNCKQLTSVSNAANWDTSEVKDMSSCFRECTSLTGTPTATWDTSNVTNLAYFAHGINGITNWWNGLVNLDTSNVIDMQNAFSNMLNLNTLRLNNWTIPNVTSMRGMFAWSQNLTTLYIPNWNTHNVEDMYYMFAGLSKLNVAEVFKNFDKTSLITCGNIFRQALNNATLYNNIQLQNLYMPNLKEIKSMFESCPNLKIINMANIYAPNIENFNNMFYGCTNLTTVDITNLDTSHATNMINMFGSCSNLTSVIGIENLDTSNCTEITNIFRACNNLPNVHNIVKNFNVSNVIAIKYPFPVNCKDMNLDLTGWTFNNLHRIETLFNTAITSNNTFVNMSTWNTSKVENINNPFIGCLYNFDISGWDTSNCYNFSNLFVTNFPLDSINKVLNVFDFSNTKYLVNTFYRHYGITEFDFASFKNLNNSPHDLTLSFMFRQCGNLTTVNMDSLAGKSIHRMERMFSSCYNLTTIQGLENLNTDNLVQCTYLFENCINLSQSTAATFTNLNLSSIEGLQYTFYNCKLLSEINLSNKNLWDCVSLESTFNSCSNLTDINFNNATLGDYVLLSSAFYACTNLTNIDLNFNNEVHIPRMLRTFMICRNITNIDLTKFNLSNCTIFTNVFCGCSNLINVEIPRTIINTENSIAFDNMFSSCVNLTTLNLSNLICNTSYTINVANMFYNCNSYVSTHLEDICDFVMRFNVPNAQRNISNTYILSPIYGTNVQVNSSTVSAETLSRLSLMGWTY